jgi:hypothetical protein
LLALSIHLLLHNRKLQALYRLSDLVVPCNATFNTSWELWLGTDPNRLMPLLNALEIEHYPCLQVLGQSHAGHIAAQPLLTHCFFPFFWSLYYMRCDKTRP